MKIFLRAAYRRGHLHRAREAQRERNDDLGAPQRLHSRSRKREKRGAGEGEREEHR